MRRSTSPARSASWPSTRARSWISSRPAHWQQVLSEGPTIIQIRKACEKIYEPIEREAERAALGRCRENSPTIPTPAIKGTAEEQAAVDAQVAATRRQFGISLKAAIRGYSPARFR